MDKAKQAVSDFMSNKGEHKTVVDQDHRAAITEEHVRPQRHEEVTTAIDKEIHQDHHQTILQPIKHSETLAEKHTHNIIPVEHKSFEHDKTEDARALIDADVAKYRDSSVTHDTTHTASKAPVVSGEHIHHHLHQHVQPVIQKDTFAPEVVHTTIPIHETHHAPTVSHGTTLLPAKTLAEFEAEHGNLLKGSGTATVGEFDGCAKTFVEGDGGKQAFATSPQSKVPTRGASAQQSTRASGVAAPAAGLGAAGATTGTGSVAPTDQSRGGGVKSMIDPVADERTSRSGANVERDAVTSGTAPDNDYKVANQAANRAYNDASVPRSSKTGGVGAGVGAGAIAAGGAATGAGIGPNNLRGSTSATSGSSKASKVSLKDKLNPFKDADGDGKKGIMS